MTIHPNLSRTTYKTKTKPNGTLINRPSRGFNLAELMLSVAMFTVAILALLSLLVVSRSATYTTGRAGSALFLAQAEICKLQQKPFQELEAYLNSPPASRQEQVGDTTFEIKSTFSRLDNNPTSPDYRVIKALITVSWTDRTLDPNQGSFQRRQAQVVLETQLSGGANY